MAESSHFKWVAPDRSGDALCRAYEAQAVIAASAEEHCSAALNGVDDLVGLAVSALVESEGGDDSLQLKEHASAQLEQAIAVLVLVNEGGLDDMLLYAGRSLLAMSKRILDAHIEAIGRFQGNAAMEVNHGAQ